MDAARATAAPRATYDDDVSAVYDLFYAGRGQDFAGDADMLWRVVRDRCPGASSVLDVACGTGEHLRTLGALAATVEGVELSGSMCARARRKLPGVPIHEGDMRTFVLDRRFDAVCCLTSSLGYMSGVEELAAAVRRMVAHLEPGGVLVLDPYWSPETFLDGHVAHDIVRDDAATLARASRSTRTGRTVHHEAHYLVAGRDGIHHLEHVQLLTLFTREQYLGAVRAAGCRAEHVPAAGGFAARGLVVGVRIA